MSWKRGFQLGLTSAILASIACYIYSYIYSVSFFVDFSKVINIMSILSSCIIACLLMAVGYVAVIKWKGERFIGWANVLYSILSFASIVAVLSFNLPLDIEVPEMFPGLAIPMHFFPVLSLITIFPFFTNKTMNIA